MLRVSPTILAVLVSGAAALGAIDPAKLPPAANGFDFEKQIRPLLEQNCVGCHGAEKEKGKFRLDARDFLLKGGENGVDVVPGKSAESALIHAVARLDDDTAMPPKKEKALSAAQVGLLRAWIDAGAPYPEGFVLRATVPEGMRLDADQLAKLPPPAARQVDFVKDVQPIFAEHCIQCHGEKRQEAAFRLDDKAVVLAGGELGVALVPGKSTESLLIHFVAGLRPEGRMPKKGDPLTPEQIGILRAWIDQGADFPDAASIAVVDKRKHWAFKAPVRPPVPAGTDGTANPIDAFVGARLAKEGLTWSPEADKATLLRRAHLDLTGLPPTVEELDSFLADSSARRLSARRRAAARFTALRRALGPPLARRSTVCGQQRLRERRATHRSLLPRLGGERLQSRPAVRSIHRGAARRRSASESHAGPDRRDGIPAEFNDQ